MSEADFEAYREYVLELLRKARIAMERAGLSNKAERIRELEEKIRKGELKPPVYVLEPGTVLKWHWGSVPHQLRWTRIV